MTDIEIACGVLIDGAYPRTQHERCKVVYYFTIGEVLKPEHKSDVEDERHLIDIPPAAPDSEVFYALEDDLIEIANRRLEEYGSPARIVAVDDDPGTLLVTDDWGSYA